MDRTKRRSFLTAGMASFPLTVLAQQSNRPARPHFVAAGSDRFGEHHVLGVSTTAFKVATGDANGGMFIMEHSSRKKGGPPRHVHHNEDEWWYVIDGNYIAEVGNERFQLKPGDCLLGPRGVPHVWAFVGDTPGRMLIAFAPASKMEEYFRQFAVRSGAYSTWNNPRDKENARAHGIELLGPPLPVA